MVRDEDSRRLFQYSFSFLRLVPIVNRLVLDQVCNRTDFATYWLSYDRLQCNSSCGHVRCLPGYKVEGFRCG